MMILLELRFVGTNYHGWQVQKNAASVQKTLQSAAEELFGAETSVTGCSRTDAGVHANSFFCTLEAPASFPCDSLPAALNTLLPGDIAVAAARPVGGDFHPRYDALAKEYEYLIFNGAVRDPFLVGRAWMLPGRRIDERAMDRAAVCLTGTHDFTSFCAAGGKIVDKTRTVYACDVRREGDLVVLRICANGFLYNMVRIIAGTLYEASLGKAVNVEAILAGKDRALAGRTAPPDGLYLNRVFYERDDLEARLREYPAAHGDI